MEQIRFNAHLDVAGPAGIDGFAGRLPHLRLYAKLLTSVAKGIQDGTIKVLK